MLHGRKAKGVPCRSELAREKLRGPAFIQNERVAWRFFASKLAPTKSLNWLGLGLAPSHSHSLASSGRSPVKPRAWRTNNALASGNWSTIFNPALRSQRNGS
jgi:hypothetical protein